jgi:hypothetical protein
MDQTATTIAALRRFSRPRKPTAERCDLCSAELASEHQHLLEPVQRQIICSCDACSLLFSDTKGTKYQRIPRSGEFWPDFEMSDDQWTSLNIPINLAFLFQSSVADRPVAMYPSAGGTIESLLPLESWQELTQQNPRMLEFEPDVEALLINRIKNANEIYRAPIDKCYELSGVIRTYWRGLGGGTQVWIEIEKFFTTLKSRSRVIGKNA